MIGETEYSLKKAFLWRSCNTSYLLTSIAIGAMVIAVAAPLIIFIPVIIGGYEKMVTFFALIPLGYILSRFSLVLPSIAISDKIDFGESWNISKGQGWKVFILIIMLPLLFNNGIERIYYDSIFFRPFFSFLSTILMVFEIIVLSNTYKKLKFRVNTTSYT